MGFSSGTVPTGNEIFWGAIFTDGDTPHPALGLLDTLEATEAGSTTSSKLGQYRPD
jgi:hypothetical protein